MKHNNLIRVLLFMVALGIFNSVTFAQFNFFQSKTKKVEASPNQEYYLKDSDGLWFIMVKIYKGDDARSEANKLVYELRKRYKLESYIFKYDPDESDLQKLAQKNGSKKKYRYNTDTGTQFAVLVGTFPQIDDPTLQKTLLTIKRSRPECLKEDPYSLSLTRKYEEIAKKDKDYVGFGPLGGAIAVPNPLIDKELYNQHGIVDAFLEKINSDSKYNLLRNNKMYTLRVATFTGDTTYEKNGKPEKELQSKLKMAGIKAAALCEALRKKNIEAWEFHDRESSFVTIGGFDSYGTSRADGRIELDPTINQLIEQYKGKIKPNGRGAYEAYTVTVDLTGSGFNGKKTRMDIPFDLQPVIIAVPQRPENIKRVLQVKKRQENEQQYQENIKEEISFAQSDTQRDYRKNTRAKLRQFDKNDPNQQINANVPVNNAAGIPNGTVNPQFQQVGMQNGIVNPQNQQTGLPNGIINPQFQQAGMSNGAVNPQFQQAGMSNGAVNPQFQQAGMQNGAVNPQFQQAGMQNGAVNPQFQQAGMQNGAVNPQFQQAGMSNGAVNPQFQQAGMPNGAANPQFRQTVQGQPANMIYQNNVPSNQYQVPVRTANQGNAAPTY